MLPIAFFSWWYGAGWRRIASKFTSRSLHISATLSLPLLSRTLFQPWRRIISYSGRGLGQQLAAMADNAISRCIGSLVRGTVLLAGLFTIFVVALLTLIELLIWPLLPVAPLFLLGLGALS